MNDWEIFVFKREYLDKIDRGIDSWCIEKFGKPGKDWDARYNATTGTIEVYFCNKEMLAEFVLTWG